MTQEEYKSFLDSYEQFLSNCARVVTALCRVYYETNSSQYKQFEDFSLKCDRFRFSNHFNINYPSDWCVRLVSYDGEVGVTVRQKWLSMTDDELDTYVSSKIQEEKEIMKEVDDAVAKQEEAKERAEYERLKKKFG